MAKENQVNPYYPFDDGWGLGSDWKTDSAADRDLSWGHDLGQSARPDAPKIKPGNGGASFAAWNQQTSTNDQPSRPASDLLKIPAPRSPGFYIIPRTMTGEQALAILFASAPDKSLVSRIKSLNPTFDQGFKGGEMLVLGNLINPTACLREEADLMLAAAEVRAALEPLTEAEANFLVEHQAEIATMLGGASLSLGLATDVLGKGVSQIDSTLRDIEYLHQREFAANGHLRSPQFFASRKQLFRQLDSQLKATFLGKQLGLGSYPTLRSDLGISTRSLVHHWSRSGAPGQIPGYATHMKEIAKATKTLKAGGYIGIALGATASTLIVNEVCRAGTTEECEKITFTETGGFVGGLAGGVGAPILVGGTAGPICVAIGIASGGVGGVVCALAVLGTASTVGGIVGGKFGEGLAEKIYEAGQR